MGQEASNARPRCPFCRHPHGSKEGGWLWTSNGTWCLRVLRAHFAELGHLVTRNGLWEVRAMLRGRYKDALRRGIHAEGGEPFEVRISVREGV